MHSLGVAGSQNFWRILLFIFCGSLLLAAVPRAQADTVDIYNWEFYIDDDVLEQFEAESGHSVRQTYYNNESRRDSVITSGRAAAFDLMLVDNVSLRILAEQALLLDMSHVVDALEGVFDQRWQDACGPHGIPYAYGALGMLHRSSVSKEPLRSWKQLLEPPPEHRGRVVMYEDEVDAAATALLALGLDPYSDDMDELRSAYALLQAQQPHVLAWDYNVSYGSEHGASSMMSLAMGYSGDVAPLREMTGQSDWEFLQPEEGSILWVECFTAPAGPRLAPETIEFLHFINRPEVAAGNAEAIGIGSANIQALQLVTEEYRQSYLEQFSAQTLRLSSLSHFPSFNGLRVRDRMLRTLVKDSAR